MTTQPNDQHDIADGGRQPLVPATQGAPGEAQDQKMAALQRQMDAAIESSGFLPLMGTFQEYLETERKRNTRRLAALAFLFIVVLALFLAGPIYLGSCFLQKADEAFTRDRQTYDQFTASVQTGLASLTAATRELKQVLAEQKAAAAPAAAGETPVAATMSNASAAVTAAPPATNTVVGAGHGEAVAAGPAAGTGSQQRLMQIVSDIENTLAVLDRERAAVTGATGAAQTPPGVQREPPVRR